VSDIYQIAASGMAVQRTQMDLIAENLANAGVVQAGSNVFHPKTAVVQSAAPFQAAMDDALEQPLAQQFSSAQAFELASAPLLQADPFDIVPFGAEDGAREDGHLGGGVTVAGIVEQQRPAQFRLDPGNPLAARSGPHKGYVALPDIDPIQQMVELVASGRAYDADVSMLEAAKQMDLAAADIERA
jgi:flagellar basal-body rod protein FlgC